MFERVSDKPFERAVRNVWAPRVNDAGVVSFLTDKEAIWLASVHWRPAEKRSVPCSGDGSCRDCETSTAITKAYAPVLLYRGYLVKTPDGWQIPTLSDNYSSVAWSPRTLEITRSIAHLVAHAKPGLLVLIDRPGTIANAPTRARVMHSTLKVPDGLVWDVRTSLKRTWGAT